MFGLKVFGAVQEHSVAPSAPEGSGDGSGAHGRGDSEVGSAGGRVSDPPGVLPGGAILPPGGRFEARFDLCYRQGKDYLVSS